MLVPNQIVTINWHPRNKKHFEEKGYKYTHTGLPFEVKAEDLMPTSHIKVKVQCDYCDAIIERPYRDYLRYRKDSGIDCCKNCHIKKSSETNQKRYGGNSPFSSSEVIAKAKETFRIKYGVEWCSQSKEFREKVKNTCLKKFGDIAPAKNEQIKEKIKATNNKRYGGNSSQCDPEVRRKTMETRMRNGNFPVSLQEEEMVKRLQKIYGEDNCHPQFVLDRICFDCLLEVNDIKIDVEYDGIFWHSDKHKDMRRDYFTIGQGYKVLRFRGNYEIPSEQQIKEAVNYLVNTEHHVKIVELDI